MTDSLVELARRAGVVGEVIGPDHGGYEQGRRIWNGLFDRRPGAIVRPAGADDVRRVVLTAAESGLPLAVRGGGHSFPGHSTCDDGLVLDLSSMRTVTVDRDRATATAGGGALLGDVDTAGMAYDMVVPAGVVSHTGVGGLTLGGGMGWNSRRYGLTIDNLRSVDLVLADGSLQTVHASSDPDLFWAIRGGGGNFGVVTSFEYDLRPLGPAAVVTQVYSARDAKEVLADYAALTDVASRELASGFTISRDFIRLRSMWFGAPEHAEKVLPPFGRLGGAETVEQSTLSFWELQRTSDEALPWGRRYYARGGFLAGIDQPVVDWLVQCVAQAPTADCDVYVIHLGGAVSDVADEDTAYTGRDAAYYWVVNGVWDVPDDDEACLAWGRRTANGLSERSLAGNYVNEQSDVTPDVARSAYGDDTYSRLEAVKRRFDPGNLFRLNQNIRPIE